VRWIRRLIASKRRWWLLLPLRVLLPRVLLPRVLLLRVL
jgi:hypothetical protein